jgi:hypothetical protein
MKPVSTPAVDVGLNYDAGFGITTAHFPGVFGNQSMTHVAAWTINNTPGSTQCYCVNTDTWWDFILAAEPTNKMTIILTDTLYNGSGASRALYYIAAPAQYFDSATAITFTITFGPLNLATKKRKQWRAFEFVGDIRFDSVSNVLTSVSYSDDTGVTWVAAGDVDLSLPEPYRPRLTRLGASSNRMWRLSQTGACTFRQRAVDITFEKGPF